MKELLTMSDCTLLYLVYGSDSKYQLELSYSVMSALRGAGKDAPNILLICDEQNKRHGLPVQTYVMTPEEISEWTLGGTYYHATKIFAVKHALGLFGGKVCFVDTDTAFMGDPARIFDRITDISAVMHDIDGDLAGQGTWGALLEKAPGIGLSDVIRPSALMYNSGLIGVPPSMSGALDEAVDLMRVLLAIDPVFNIEQFVIGHVLGRDREIKLANDIVEHYWGYKRHIYHARIPTALAQLGGLNSPEMAKILPFIAMPRKPLWAKVSARVHRLRHRKDAAYGFAYLAYLASTETRTSDDRDIWANISLDMLSRSNGQDIARRTFKKFAPDRIRDSELSPETQFRWESYWSLAGC
ncbi:hypothetical protein ACOI1H_22915 [Loktanella sp. DJP18]|uniref:hypothetical protein n=1 Tax=Loktanella sp. DJP18 TaxID=3409788 RepID=UPI003BB78F52